MAVVGEDLRLVDDVVVAFVVGLPADHAEEFGVEESTTPSLLLTDPTASAAGAADEAEDVELELDDFNKVAARVKHIADMTPGGRYHVADLDRVGGVPMVMKHLLDAGLLHGDCHALRCHGRKDVVRGNLLTR